MGLDEAVKAFEADFAEVIAAPDAVDPDHWSHCRTGQAFHTVVSYGVKEHGSPIERGYETPDAAIAAWLEVARKMTEGRRGKLWWRHPPEVDQVKGQGWIVYSRFVSTEG